MAIRVRIVTALAVDVGGTKIAAAVIERDGSVGRKIHQPTDLRGVERVVEQIVSMSRELLGGQTPAAVGVSVPAVIENVTDRILWAPNLPGWEGADLKGMIAIGSACPPQFNMTVMQPCWANGGQGAGRGLRICRLRSSSGQGIGAGFIANGKLWKGRNRLAGAVGWFPFVRNDGRIVLGKRRPPVRRLPPRPSADRRRADRRGLSPIDVTAKAYLMRLVRATKSPAG